MELKTGNKIKTLIDYPDYGKNSFMLFEILLPEFLFNKVITPI